LITTVVIAHKKSIIYIRCFNLNTSFNKAAQELQDPQMSVIFRTQNILEGKEMLPFSV
jgi:hypothetical protein